MCSTSKESVKKVGAVGSQTRTWEILPEGEGQSLQDESRAPGKCQDHSSEADLEASLSLEGRGQGNHTPPPPPPPSHVMVSSF